MARYNKKYFKRYNRYKTLSARNIYSNKSAKSQSKQIYALKKRINKVYRACKPEYKIYDGLNTTYNFSSSDITNTYKIIYWESNLEGVSDTTHIGNKVRSIAFDTYFTGEYYNNSNTGYHGTESSGSPFRIIILQRKAPSNDSISISDVLSTSGGSGANYTMQAICPLQKGITEQFNVLLDKKIIFTTSKNQAIRHYRVRPRNIRWDPTGYYNGFITLLISAGLHYDSNFNEFITGTMRQRYIYTDA